MEVTEATERLPIEETTECKRLTQNSGPQATRLSFGSDAASHDTAFNKRITIGRRPPAAGSGRARVRERQATHRVRRGEGEGGSRRRRDIRLVPFRSHSCRLIISVQYESPRPSWHRRAKTDGADTRGYRPGELCRRRFSCDPVRRAVRGARLLSNRHTSRSRADTRESCGDPCRCRPPAELETQPLERQVASFVVCRRESNGRRPPLACSCRLRSPRHCRALSPSLTAMKPLGESTSKRSFDSLVRKLERCFLPREIPLSDMPDRRWPPPIRRLRRYRTNSRRRGATPVPLPTGFRL